MDRLCCLLGRSGNQCTDHQPSSAPLAVTRPNGQGTQRSFRPSEAETSPRITINCWGKGDCKTSNYFLNEKHSTWREVFTTAQIPLTFLAVFPQTSREKRDGEGERRRKEEGREGKAENEKNNRKVPPNWVTTVQLPTLTMRMCPRKMTVSFYLAFLLMLPRLAARKISFE